MFRTSRVLKSAVGTRWMLLTLILSTSGTRTFGNEIRWRSDDSISTPAIQSSLLQVLDRLAIRPNQTHLVVHFDGPVAPEIRTSLQENGLILLSYLGDDAYFAAFANQGIESENIASVVGLNDATEIQRNWKVHLAIASESYPDYARATNPTTGEIVVIANVLFHPDVDLHPDGETVVSRHGGEIVSELFSLNVFVVEIPLANLNSLADEDIVQWIEPPLPAMTATNAENRLLTQAEALQSAPYGLNGAGVGVMVFDAGFALAAHSDFGGRLTIRDLSGLSGHATHVAGTIGGDGASSSGAFRGMAPGVTIESYGFEYDGSNIFLYDNPGDMEADYVEAVNLLGVDIANNSIASNIAANNYPCEFTGDYGITAALIDQIVTGSLGSPFRIIWANGNERAVPRCGDTYATTPPPAGAKNHITVGAVNADDEGIAWFSSWGPVDDGRLKPDITAPGCQVTGDQGVTSCSETGGYATMCGTSMAAPTVTGIVALMLQDFRNQFPALPDPRNATIKALLAHNAKDLGNPGPDFQFGYGSVQGRDTIDHMRRGDTAFDERTITLTGASYFFHVAVAPGTEQLKLTLAWDDAPATPNTEPALINDLDLQVFGPGPTFWLPWTLDPDNPDLPAAQGQPDHVNNIEQVTVAQPDPGTWLVRVVGTNIPDGPQPFTICASPDFVPEGVSLSVPAGPTTLLDPAVATPMGLQIVAIDDALVSGSCKMKYRFNSGESFQSVLLDSLGNNQYMVDLPPANCGDVPEFYFTAEGVSSGVVTLPADAPSTVFKALVGEFVTLFMDDFETDQGWTALNMGAVNGDWDRGVPVNDPGWLYDPAADSDGSGQCFLTENQAGNSDIDGGSVALVSPAIDMTGGQVTISYDYFLELSNDLTGNDRLTVEINNNDGIGPWTEIASHDMDGELDWHHHDIFQTDLDAAGVTFSPNVRLRFVAGDDDPQGVVEAALDAVTIVGLNCAQMFPDCNHDGQDDVMNIALGESLDCDGDGMPDECEPDTDGDGDIDDCEECPNDPNKTEPGMCGCGVIDPPVEGDMNDDGVLNGIDIRYFVEAATGGIPTPEQICRGDTNASGDLDAGDIPGLLVRLIPEACGQADFNGDGKLDGRDIGRFVDLVVNSTATELDTCRGDFDNSEVLDTGDIPGLINAILTVP